MLKDNYSNHRIPRKVVLRAWLLVGTLDILSAFVDYYVRTGKDPLFILNYVASGVLGESAFSGGAGTMLLGLLFHYFCAFLFTIFFFWFYSKFGLVFRSKIVTGILYGIFIWAVMNLVVVQLCRAAHATIKEMKAEKVLKAMTILIFMIGLPLAFIAGKYSPKNSSPSGEPA